MPTVSVPIADKFAVNYHPEPNSGCWLWAGSMGGNGYGRVQYKSKTHLAHRSSWELHKGPIPTGLRVCHKCDTPLCVNPSHLFLGSNADNMQDASRKGRLNWREGEVRENLKKGEYHPAHVLTESDVRMILASAESGAGIARRLGVCRSLISRIRKRRAWAWVK